MVMFGAMGNKRGKFDSAPEVYATPGIGDGLHGAPAMGDPGLGFGAPPVAPTAPPSKFGARDIIGIIGEALGGAAGNGPGAYTQMKLQDRQRAQQQQQYQQQRQDKREDWRIQADYEASQPQKVGDSIVRVDPATGAPEVIYRGEPQKTETERLIETWANLPDSDPRKGLIEASLRGAQYNPSIYQPMIDYKTKGQIAVKSATPGKAPSTARSGGPRSAPKPPAGFILD